MTLFTFLLKLRAVKIKLFAIIILLFSVSLLSYVLFENLYKSRNEQKRTKQPWNMTFEYIVVHFDLKGAPPLLSYLQSTFKILKDHGTNALLIEYEDMFPYEGTLVNLTARNCYKRDQLKQFLMTADQMGLEVIPLVPTFGHLEFALKLKEFQHLREDPKFPDSICPNKKESKEFLKEMLKQVIKFHSSVTPLKHIHIGCNEVHQIKVCDVCSKKKLNKLGIIIEHIKFINGVIEDLSPKTKILIWDDMIRHIQPVEFVDLKMPNTESVSWDTAASDLAHFHPALHKYQQIFGNMWVSTAYKGADGPTRTIPNLRNRFKNYINWLNFIMTYDCLYHTYHFKGIILTGRSRYSHMEPPCELLPVAMPSLILNLITIEKYYNGIAFYFLKEIVKTVEQYEQSQRDYINVFISEDLNAALMCQTSFLGGSLETFQAMTCIFEGSDLYVMLTRCAEARILYALTFYGGHDSNLTSNINPDDMKQGYMNMMNVKNILDASVSTLKELVLVESQVVDSMTPYFDKYVIEEYIILKLSMMKENLQSFIQFLSDYYVIKDWPRRPSISISASLQDEIEKRIKEKKLLS